MAPKAPPLPDSLEALTSRRADLRRHLDHGLLVGADTTSVRGAMAAADAALARAQAAEAEAKAQAAQEHADRIQAAASALAADAAARLKATLAGLQVHPMPDTSSTISR